MRGGIRKTRGPGRGARALRRGAWRCAVVALVLPGLFASRAAAQSFLERFSYEGLGVAGIGAEFGVIASDRLTTEPTGAVRIDYGTIAPNVRVLIGVGYFRGAFDATEIAKFETQLRGVVRDPTNDFTIDVGTITLTDVEADLSLQYLFDTGSPVVTTYLGLGLSAHIRNGTGAAIDNTFVEDALDTIAAGLGLSLGVQVAVTPAVHLTADLRGGLTSELRTASARAGLMYRLPRGRNP